MEIKKSETFQRKLVTFPFSSIQYDRERQEIFSKRKEKKNPPPLLISNISNISLSTGINFPTLINRHPFTLTQNRQMASIGTYHTRPIIGSRILQTREGLRVTHT